MWFNTTSNSTDNDSSLPTLEKHHDGADIPLNSTVHADGTHCVRSRCFAGLPRIRPFVEANSHSPSKSASGKSAAADCGDSFRGTQPGSDASH